ncbi:hypothetical protein [Saccharopolyspora pogona]|uniref:hypothetical protein n=1 Tax=Saccharopolyspora pogona TaxID=333966 RepID=UPI001CC266FB|nr:hypothetical protein [Saccharopolyspora pogona]
MPARRAGFLCLTRAGSPSHQSVLARRGKEHGCGCERRFSFRVDPEVVGGMVANLALGNMDIDDWRDDEA